MLRLTCLILGFLVLPLCGRGDEPASAKWKAGAAKILITPMTSMWMSGYAARTKPAQGKLNDLWAKALVLEDPQGRRSLLVTLDLVGVDREFSVAVREKIERKHKLPRSAIILSTSHTHSGPVVRSNLITMYSLDETQERYVREYADDLQQKILQVVGEAFERIGECQLSWGHGQATFAANRRANKEADVPKLRNEGKIKGPYDHDVPVLVLRDGANKLRAVIFGYACHATVLDGYLWSGDYPGFAQDILEQNHPDTVAMFWAGCGADQNPIPRRKVELAEKYGRQLAEAVDAVLQKPLRPLQGNLGTAYMEIDLPFADLPTRDRLVQDTMSRDKYVASRARALLKRIEREGSLKGTYPYPVQVWQLGRDITFVSLGGEVVVDYVLRLKKEIEPGQVWVMGYANDVMAYIPSLRILKEGGYEGGGAMVYYGQPTVWAPQVEEQIVATVHEQVKKARSAMVSK